MPTYQYACTECGEQLEVVQKFTDDALTTCPACAGRLRKVFSAVGVVFKGSGFYRTDSRAGSSESSNGKAAAGSSADSSGGSGSDSSGGSGADSSGGSRADSSGDSAKPAAARNGSGSKDSSSSASASTSKASASATT